MMRVLIPIVACLAALLTAPPPASASEGGSSGEYRQVVGTAGFWRLAEDAEGVWWFLSPEGERQFLNTVTTVQPYQTGRRRAGPHYVSRDWDGQLTGSLNDGDVPTWAVKTLARVKDAGFKGIGAWSHRAFHDEAINPDLPVTRDLNLWTYAIGEARRVFHPEFARVVDEAVRNQVTPLRDSRTLVGYFTDNELDWADWNVGPRAHFDGLPQGDPSRLAVLETIRELWPTVEAYNADWGTAYASFDDLAAESVLTVGPGYDRLFRAFIRKVSGEYFRITAEAVRRHDPNHLVLGVRYRGYAIPEVIAGQAGHTDAISINYYVGDARLDQILFETLHRASGGQPVMVTEYGFHALDGRSGNRNTFGFVAQVPDQAARAEGYRLMTRRLAAVPYIVGADWFQWSDEPPSGREMDGEDVNFGVVDVDDHEYEILVEAVRETTPTLDPLHAMSTDPQIVADAWRPCFIEDAPAATLPYLHDAPRIDGSLRDWTDAQRLAGVRKNAIVGADRRDEADPTVYAGWNEAGLYVAVEVADPQIQAAPATGPWWTQDAVELFISTRGDDADRPERGYGRFDHQFFFVPNPFPEAGRSGTWGRWSRPGDALGGQHQIPAPGVADAARVLPGRYVTELFIPADQLVGFDPATATELRFNVHVRDYQSAVEHFWSAPKQADTAHRPATWGRLHLERPSVAAAPTDYAE